MKIRLLSQADVRQALPMPRAIELMETAFRALSSGEINAPVRTNLANEAGTLLYKPVLWDRAKAFGIKAVSVFPGNPRQGLPVTTGLMLINDGETGVPLALMDAEYLTAVRTGAATGLATRLLANPDVTCAAIFGTGGQAAYQLQALLAVLPLERIAIFGRETQKAQDFCQRHQGDVPTNCKLQPGDSHEELRECGVIVTATTSKTPVFVDDNIAAGTHINGIGSFTASTAEVPPQTVARSTIIVDQRAAALAEAGDIAMPMRSGLLPGDLQPAELGEVLLQKRDGRTSAEQVTFFKSVGNAAQDIVCAADVLQTALREGLGQTIDL